MAGNTCFQKGFLTMAYGEKYCKLAEHLYMSYKLFGNCDYPFYCITNQASAERLGKVFDGVIVKDNFVKSTSDKLMFFTDNPFDESVFIDSDCSIVNDVNYIFEEFEQNGSPISAVADYRELSNPEKGAQFGINAIKELGITHDFPNFNGGVYYYKKCPAAEACKQFIFDTIMPNYNHFGLRVRDNGAFAGEPPVVLGMLKFGFTPVPPTKNIMYLVHNKAKVKWNMKKRTCSFRWYEYTVHPTIIHWTVGGTEKYRFEKYDAKVRGQFEHRGRRWIKKREFLSFVKYYIYPKLLKVFPGLRKKAQKYKD